MNRRSVPLGDAAFAEFYSGVSRGLKLAPLLNDLIVGDNNVPYGWQHIPEPASQFSPWTTFDRDPTGTRLPIPRLYKMAGVLAVERAELDDLLIQNPSARSAVALSLGKAVVIGALAEGVPYAQYMDDARQLIATRIAGSDLIAAAGLWVPGDRRFVIAQSSEFAARVPLNEVPSMIPIA